MTILEPILRIRGLSKTYNREKSEETRVHALQDVSLEVFPGEFVAVVGVSGSGKSTLLHCVGSFEEPDRESRNAIEYRRNGEFYYLREDRSWYRQNFIGVIFQAFHLLPNLRVSQNVDVPLRLRKCERYEAGLAERRTAVHGVLVQLGIDKLANKRINAISGGECQRVAIARALVKHPRLLLADEPTGNLDVKHTREIVRLLRELSQEGMAVLMVTHNVEIAREYADRIVTLSDGQVTGDERITTASAESAELRPTCAEDYDQSFASQMQKSELLPRTASDDGWDVKAQDFDEVGSQEVGDDHGQVSPRADVSSAVKGASSERESGLWPETGPAEMSADESTSRRGGAEIEVRSCARGPRPRLTGNDVSDKEGQPLPTEGYSKLIQNVSDEARLADGGLSKNECPSSAGVESDEQSPELHGEPLTKSPVCPEGRDGIEAIDQAPDDVLEQMLGKANRPSAKHSFFARMSNAFRRIRLPWCDMGFCDLTGFALRDAKESSVSLFANVVAILFGTVLTALLLSLVFGAERYMRGQITKIPQIETVSVWVDYSTGADPISEQDYEQLKQWPLVTQVVPDIKQMAWLHKRPTRQIVAAFTSAIKDDPATKRLELISGTGDIDPDGWDVIIPERVACELDNFDPLGMVGETITLELRRYSKGTKVEDDAAPSKVLRYPVRVVGIVKTSPYDRIYASINMVRFVRDFGTMRSEYVAAPSGKSDLAKISPRTMNEAVRLHFSTPGEAERAFQEMRTAIGQRFEVHWAGEDYLYLRDVQLVAFLVFLGIGMLTITAGSISVFNTLQASVLRKTREIGILRALGLNRFSIFFVYMLQSVFVAILAGLAGIGLSALIINTVNPAIAEHWKLKDLQSLLILPAWTMLGVVGVVICICAAAALIPAWRAAQRTPMDAIREAAS